MKGTHKFIVGRVRAFGSCPCFPSTDLTRVWQKIKFSVCTWGRAIWEVLENKKVTKMNVHVLAKKTNKKAPNEIWAFSRHRNTLHPQVFSGLNWSASGITRIIRIQLKIESGK